MAFTSILFKPDHSEIFAIKISSYDALNAASDQFSRPNIQEYNKAKLNEHRP